MIVLNSPTLVIQNVFHTLSIRRSTGSIDRLAQVDFFSSANELQQQSTDLLRLFLLYPMSRTVNKITTAPLRRGDGLHSLKHTGVLVDAPIVFAAMKQAGTSWCGEKTFQARRCICRQCIGTIADHPGNPVTKFGGVHSQFFIGKPFAASNLFADGISSATVSAIPLPKSMT